MEYLIANKKLSNEKLLRKRFYVVKMSLKHVLLINVFCILPNLYSIQFINLGLTNLLDGGPIRPYVGWYFQNILEGHHAPHIKDGKGKTIGGSCSPTYDLFSTLPMIIYESKYRLLGGRFGGQATLPIVLVSKVKSHGTDISTSGSGLSDLNLGVYLQWDPILYKGKPFFVHRLEFDTSFPTGKNKEPKKTINPGSGFFWIHPYWAATLYITEKITASWRFFYLWNGFNKKTGVKLGDEVHLNFDLAVSPYTNVWVGGAGYFLRSIKNATLCGKNVPDTRARILGVGPAFLCFLPHDIKLFGSMYVERLAINRPQGYKFVLRFFKYF